MPIKSRWTIPIPRLSLPSLIFTSPTHPLSTTKAALIDTNRPFTHYLTPHTYRLWSQRIAAGLRAAGLQPGDRVLLFSGNTLLYPALFMGVVMAGGIFSGANPTYVARELAHQLRDTGARFLICAGTGTSLETGLEAAGMVGMGREGVFVFGDEVFDGNGKAEARSGCRSWGELIASEEEGRRFAWEELSTDEELSRTVALNYSSGTTGVPKGVEITHYNYVANAYQVRHMASLAPDYEAKTKRARWLCFLPMYHAMAQTIFIAVAPLRGIPVYIMPKFDFLQVLENVQRFKITDLTMVPPVVVALAKHPAVRSGKYDLSSVEHLLSGAAPLGREVSEEVEALWEKGKINLKQAWGMTEATCSILGWDPRQTSTSSSVGELSANCEAKVMDDDGLHEVPQGQRGEIWVRAPNVMKGYWRNPKATKETKTDDGWLKTGDICYIDEDGKFFVVDRKKELIKVKGNQVAPAELEALLLEHPAVADAAVIGVTIDGEEMPRAYIVLKEGKNATGDEIVKFMDKKVSRTKRITGGVSFVQSIPKNPSGKILRKLIREAAKAEDGNTEARASKL